MINYDITWWAVHLVRCRKKVYPLCAGGISYREYILQTEFTLCSREKMSVTWWKILLTKTASIMWRLSYFICIEYQVTLMWLLRLVKFQFLKNILNSFTNPTFSSLIPVRLPQPLSISMLSTSLNWNLIRRLVSDTSNAEDLLEKNLKTQLSRRENELKSK